MDLIRRQLEALASRPEMPSPEYDAWLQLKEPLAFLAGNARQDELVVYAVADNVFIHAVFVPAKTVKRPDADDLLKWNGNAYSSWGVCTSYQPKKRVHIEPPLSGMGPKAMTAGEQIVFVRDFDGFSRSYIELLQKFVHASGIHYVRERDAWCTLDDNGDLQDEARIIKIPPTDNARGGRAVAVKRRLIDRYAAMTGMAVVRMFDFTHFTPSNFSSWASEREETLINSEGLIYRQWVQGDASFARGVQIIKSKLTQKDLLAEDAWSPKKTTKQYASFIAQDWKN